MMLKRLWRGRSENMIARTLKAAAGIFLGFGLIFSLYQALEITYVGVVDIHRAVAGFRVTTALACFGVYVLWFLILFGLGVAVDFLSTKSAKK